MARTASKNAPAKTVSRARAARRKTPANGDSIVTEPVNPSVDSGDSQDWLRDQIASVQAVLNSRGSDSLRLVEQILERGLNREPDTETAARLIESLSIALGDNSTGRSFLYIISQCFSDHAYLDEVRSIAGDEFRATLEDMVALHGRNVSHALSLDGVDPLGWRDFRRYVYRDLVSGQWRVRVIVTLNSGQDVTLRDSPDSMVLLAEAILDTLTFLPVEEADQAVTIPRRDSLQNAFDQFMSRFTSMPPTVEMSENREESLATTPA